MADPVSVTDANGEWIEIFNTTNNSIDLNGFYLSDGGADTMQIISTNPTIIPPSGFFIFAKNADINQNGGVSVNYSMGGFTVNNSNSSIILTDSLFNVIDEISYTSSTPGKSTNLDPFYFDAVSNDNTANWCDAINTYGLGDFGTPGSVNPSCGTVSVNDQAAIASSVYYGNAEGLLVCKLASDMRIQVNDLSGRLIYKSELSKGNHRLDIDISNGMYIYTLSSGSDVLSGKFVKSINALSH